jgi:hypothetical protein
MYLIQSHLYPSRRADKDLQKKESQPSWSQQANHPLEEERKMNNIRPQQIV